MSKNDDNDGLNIEVIAGGDLGESIAKAIEHQLKMAERTSRIKQDAEKSANSLLDMVSRDGLEDRAKDLVDKIHELFMGNNIGVVTLALANVVADTMTQRIKVEELHPDASPEYREQAEHEANCFNCFHRHATVRLAAFGILLSRIAEVRIAQEPDAPEEAKAMLNGLVDKVEGRSPSSPLN